MNDLFLRACRREPVRCLSVSATAAMMATSSTTPATSKASRYSVNSSSPTALVLL